MGANSFQKRIYASRITRLTCQTVVGRIFNKMSRDRDITLLQKIHKTLAFPWWDQLVLATMLDQYRCANRSRVIANLPSLHAGHDTSRQIRRPCHQTAKAGIRRIKNDRGHRTSGRHMQRQSGPQ